MCDKDVNRLGYCVTSKGNAKEKTYYEIKISARIALISYQH